MKSLKHIPGWKLAKGMLVDPLRRLAFETVYRGQLPLYYCESPNWGDALSPVLCSMLSGKPVKKMLWGHQNRYFVIGSILDQANARAQVWGSGFMWPDARLAEAPKAVYAVRGPLTRKKLLEQGIECPEVFGDPALLFPKLYNPRVEKTHAIGIIPHFSEKGHPWVEAHRRDPQVRIIDVEGGIGHFVEEVKSCEFVLSSSLHGLICADAYGVPNQQIELTGTLYGGNFKFFDYFGSVGRDAELPARPDATSSINSVMRSYRPYRVEIDLDKLLRACPFLDESVLARISDGKQLFQSI